jgi:phage replication O-like protein O
MASPQKENGNIPIANEIAEALAHTNLNGYENRYLWVLWRKTYGWHKKEDFISNSQFSDATGIKRPHIWRTQQMLIQRNIVTKLGNKLSFQKDYTQWRELPKKVTVTKSGTRVTKLGTKVTKSGAYKRNYTKETITKETSDVPSPDIVSVIDSFKEVNQSYGKWYGNTTQRDAIARLIKTQTLEKVLSVIRILPQTNKIPYITTITTPLQLEEKWSTLESQLIKKKMESIKSKPNVIFS